MAEPDDRPARLELEIVSATAHISGRLRLLGAAAWTPFDGWVGMSGALVDALDGARGGPAEPPEFGSAPTVP